MVGGMFLLPGIERVIVSPSDLRLAAQCEWALIAKVDVLLQRRAAMPLDDDPVMARAAALGAAHEQAVFRDLVADRADRVVAIGHPRHSAQGYAAADAAALAALRSPQVDVVYQGAFFDSRFLGFADFVVRSPQGPWQVWDTKLARHADVPALLQIAAYADHLEARSVPLAREAVLVLGSGDHQLFPLQDIVPVYRSRRARLLTLLDEHQDEAGAGRWGDERWHACGRCPACHEELVAHDDVLLVAGVRATTRTRLRAAGVETMADLVGRLEPVAGVPEATLTRIRAQARLQLQQRDTDVVIAEVFDPAALAALPAPSHGDVFFDFEGDPLWREPGSPTWGLEYLFGIIEAPVDSAAPVFRAFWAHDRLAEKQALIDFIGYVQQRRRQHPDMHIYHYAAYEKSRLLSLAARYGVCEAEVDSLLEAGILVDLYAAVKASVRVSQDSYSIKKLEPLYMGADHRVGEVTGGGESIEVYHQYTQARIEGRLDEAAQLLETIRSYNEYDCLSTLRLRDWLLRQAGDHGVTIGAQVRDVAETEEPHPLETRLRDLLGSALVGPRTLDQQSLAMVAASIQYNRRERKPWYWAHYARLQDPVDQWIDGPDTVHVTDVQVLDPGWFKESPRQNLRRVLQLTDAPGSSVRPEVGTRLYALYDAPLPDGMSVEPPIVRAFRGVEVLAVEELSGADGASVRRLEVLEVLGRGLEPYDNVPIALAPTPPPPTSKIDEALAEVGAAVADAWPQVPATAGLAVLRRTAPELTSGALPPVGEGDERFIEAITCATRDLTRSYLAVQGPAGTGKTYVAAKVIAHLVAEDGWRVGVIAQSHAAIENVLDAVVKAGLDPARVGKSAKHRTAPTWTDVPDNKIADFAQEHHERGYVLGGTVFMMTNSARVGRGQLDLLVVDEAGQYSLANTLAASVAAQRLLLLGDPAQLAEVSTGSHPEPIGDSALAWLIEGAEVLPPARGYFLDTTWRMHPALSAAVSDLSYAGQLRSQESVTAARSLDGVLPGLHVVRVAHRDNAAESVEEAEVIAARIHELLGRHWLDPDEDEPGRPLRQGDIRVVTPYNAQVRRLAEVLAAAGLDEVAVGTVDKFQGQEGAVVFLSMAVSAPSEGHRGLGFLLQRNRLNVSISRGKWAAFIVCSDALTDFTPTSADELVLLGAFLHLIESATSSVTDTRPSPLAGRA